MLKEMWNGSNVERLVLITGAAFILFLIIGIPWVVWQDSKDEARWERFKTEHKCKIVTTTAASSHVGIGTTSNGKSGVVIIYRSGQGNVVM